MRKNEFTLGAHYYMPGYSARENWAKDLDRMRETGITAVQAVAAWNWIHVSRDEFDWEDLRLFVEAASSAGLRVQLGLVLESAPEWVAAQHEDWLYVNQRGERLYPYARTRYQYGGWPGVCFDHDDARHLAGLFVRQLGEFAESHAAVTEIEVWTGVTFPPSFHRSPTEERFCFCPATSAAFIEWLRRRHGHDIALLNKKWKRSFTDWSQVKPPRFFGTFPDELDWCRFLLDRQGRMLKWRIEMLRGAGFSRLLTAHAGLDHPLQPHLACDDHACAAAVDEWGFTNAQVVEGKKRAYLLFFGADFARSAAREKPYRLSQLRIGPFASETLQKEAGHSAAFVQLNNWAAIAGGVSNICYRSWRPQTSGHEAGGYGLTTLSGELNDRTAAVARVAKLAAEHPHIADFRPVRGDVAILVLPESINFNYVTESGSAEFYEQAVKGTYKAFFDRNILADFVRVDGLSDYRVIYMPWPFLLREDDVARLAAYVESGGTLVSEACPGKFDYDGFRNEIVPPGVLQQVFGCRETDVTQMISNEKTAPVIAGRNKHYPCANCQSFLEPTTGKSIGVYLTGEVAVVDNTYGSGKARLIGTNPSICYLKTEDIRAADLICASLPYAGVVQRIRTTASAVQCRWLEGTSTDLFIMVNLTNVPATTTIESEWDTSRYEYAVDWATGVKTKIKKLGRKFTVPSHEMLALEFTKA